MLLDSVSFAAREGPRIVNAARRIPLALPTLPSETVALASGGKRALSNSEAERIAANRQKAMCKRIKRQQDAMPPLRQDSHPDVFTEEDDVFDFTWLRYGRCGSVSVV